MKKKSTIITRSFLLLLIIMVCITIPARQVAEDAREIFKNNQDAVIRINIVQKTRIAYPGMSTQESESRSETVGTFINEDGLVVASLSAIDPTHLYTQIMGGRQDDIQFDVEISSLKIILPDGREIDGKLVLRDMDFDLAFIKPVEELPAEIKYIDLTASAKADILEELVMLTRLGQEARRTPAVSIIPVQAKIDRPRTFYVPSQSIINENLGNPVFNTEGRFIGFTILRFSPTAQDMTSSLFSSIGNMGILGVIIPAEDVLEIKGQIAPETSEEENPEKE